MEQPIVSIIVITYNSAQTVLETLESAKAQDYENIEVIISDDGSKDETANICRDWLENNNDRFFRTELLTVEKNSGIPANCNRGVKAASGKWIKLIAGDDILFPKCISDNINFVSKTDIEILQTLSAIYYDDFNGKMASTGPKDYTLPFFELPDGHSQFKYLIFNDNQIYAPSMFMSKKLIERVGFFNEKYTQVEDFPFWCKVTKLNIKIYFNPIITVGYRVKKENPTANLPVYQTARYKNLMHFRKFELNTLIPLSNISYHQNEVWDWILFQLTTRVFKNKKSAASENLKYLFWITRLHVIKKNIGLKPSLEKQNRLKKC